MAATKQRHLDAWGNPWGTRPRHMERRLADFPPGRRCRKRGCITVLSTYNPGPECYLHSPEMPWEVIAAEPQH